MTPAPVPVSARWPIGAGFLVFLALALAAPVLVPYVDDAFFSQWAAEYGRTGKLSSAFLGLLFPDLATLLVYPPVHVVFSGWLFRAEGFAGAAFDHYLYLSAFACAAGFALAGTRLYRSRAVAYSAPAIVAAVYLIYPFRPEVTGCALLALGIGIGFMADGPRRMIGIFLLTLGPLASPSCFGLSVCLIGLQELALLYRRGPGGLPRQLAELILPGLLAVLLFLAVIDFQAGEFVRQFLMHAGAATQAFNLQSLLIGLAMAGMGAVLWWLTPGRAVTGDWLALAALGAGVVLSELFHIRGFTRDLVLAFALVAFVAGLNRRLGHAPAIGATIIGIIAVGFLAGYLGNLVSMNLLGTRIAPETRQAELAALRRSVDALYVDDVVVRDLLDFDTDGIRSWPRSKPFPGGRPESLDELRPGEAWLIAKYSLFGYLRGMQGLVTPEQVGGYATAPSLGCYAGRVSCRLPDRAFDYVLFIRDHDGTLTVRPF